MIAEDRDCHNARLHIRGNHKNLGEEVPRRFLQVIAGEQQPPITSGSGRLHIANWMASADNPLTARVMVNRIWKHHFGSGIVRSTDNFGKMGEAPTHPELLDYLASRFVESGWSVKSHASADRPEQRLSDVERRRRGIEEVDPANKLLQHMPVRRLEAEEIRDTMLATAGTLDRKMFGPSVPPLHQRVSGRPRQAGDRVRSMARAGAASTSRCAVIS